MPALYHGCDFLADAHYIGTACALQENGPRHSRKPPENRPAPDFDFGNEYRRHERDEHENVEVAQMVADQQSVMRTWTSGLDLDCQNAQHPPGGTLQPKHPRTERG